ncbi:hypothetical protein O7606_07115 [Micromonospora sp. WMMD882]|uniref:hypothetical protein n=1 Tax=Micromonospora sp. WMMD882 TaxID=3015151 RepID=UPI00248D22C5|nr:hypothetical protein [Micromonospora sp. WMMD882]WBB81142.1 hypothetical protein O7606_07115 [Micromonospora sp. WMMD882]
MSEPEESAEDVETPEPIAAPPTANPARVQVPPEGPGALAGDGEPPRPGPSGPGEET